LNQRNGFYAFQGALLVRPLQNPNPPLGILQWNMGDLWKAAFDSNLIRFLSFAEDIFGGQFGIMGPRVMFFEPETGQIKEVAGSLTEWASVVIDKPNFWTGSSLAQAWQRIHGSLRRGYRLVPKLPFVLGGQFSVDNLYAVTDREGMLSRAEIANQIKDVPDGATIVLKSRPTD
jgi:hypothetical protein